MNFAMHTQYPKIFSNTYWGRSSVPPNRVEPEVMENRNRFVQEFSIVRLAQERTKSLWHGLEYKRTRYGFLDHPEAYMTAKNRYVLLFSNYFDNEFNHPAFEVWHPLYALDAVTYIAEFENRFAIKQALS